MTLMDIAKLISSNLKEVSYINAMWIEGSWATGKNNNLSDIDIWLDVEDNSFEQSIEAFRQSLSCIGEIDWEKSRGIYSDNPKLQKQTFHLSGFTEPQCIELDLQQHSRNFKFDRIENPIIVLFDKNNTIQWKED